MDAKEFVRQWNVAKKISESATGNEPKFDPRHDTLEQFKERVLRHVRTELRSIASQLGESK